ncbi:MAG: bifunctional DNA primase/polymerase [Planctomycetaceae bacterium]|nr:bifunctional DNA primase/polymerase [Planctomycetaceae bacterium]
MADRDLAVFPLVYGTNKPLGFSNSTTNYYGHLIYPNGKLIYGVRDATTNLAKLVQMFQFRKCDYLSPYNMGVACGNVTVLDFDDFWSDNTQQYVKEIRRIIGTFDEAAVVLTPGGNVELGGHGPGVHLFVKKYENIKSGTIIHGALDCKNDAHSYVCGAGSVRPNGVYEWLSQKWIKQHGQEEYEKILELLPVKNIILFEDFVSVKNLASLSEIQKKGLEFFRSRYFTGNYEQDKDILQRIVVSPSEVPGASNCCLKSGLEDALWQQLKNRSKPNWCLESCLEGDVEQQRKRINDSQGVYRYVTHNELLGNIKEDKATQMTTVTDTNDHQTSQQKSNLAHKSTSAQKRTPPELQQSIGDIVENSVSDISESDIFEPNISESPKIIEKAVQELFTVSGHASYEEPQKIWLDSSVDRLKIHPGWRQFYMTLEQAQEPDADKTYLLWMTRVGKIPVGYRNQFLTSVAGILCRENEKLLQFRIFLNTMLLCNSKLTVPLSNKEVKKISKSIYDRSLTKRGGNPDVVFEQKLKDKHNAHQEKTFDSTNTKQQKFKDWVQQNIKDQHKKELYFKVLLIVSMGEWNLNADENEHFDLTEFKRTVNGSASLNHTDGQTILAALHVLIKNGFFGISTAKFKSKRKKTRYADNSIHVHSVIDGITFTYDPDNALQKLNNVSKNTVVTDSFNPFGLVGCWFGFNGFLKVVNAAINTDTDTVNNSNNNNNRESKDGERFRQPLRIRRGYFCERGIRSFILYLEHRFGCDFIKEFRLLLGIFKKQEGECDKLVSHSVV